VNSQISEFLVDANSWRVELDDLILDWRMCDEFGSRALVEDDTTWQLLWRQPTLDDYVLRFLDGGRWLLDDELAWRWWHAWRWNGHNLGWNRWRQFGWRLADYQCLLLWTWWHRLTDDDGWTRWWNALSLYIHLFIFNQLIILFEFFLFFLFQQLKIDLINISKILNRFWILLFFLIIF
jgi:hypothetical protein